MHVEGDRVELEEQDFKEIFGLFSSVTDYERRQIYTPGNGQYFFEYDIHEEYELHESKEDYARDAWRAVMYFLHAKGFKLYKDERIIELSWVKEEFIGD